MSSSHRTACNWAATGTLAFAMLTAAHAQMPANRSVVPAAPAAVAAATALRQSEPPRAVPPAASICPASSELTRLVYPLRHTARKIATGEPLTIVAIGSSSTSGAGASSPAASYPSRLAMELKERLPGRDVTVLNRGVNGEETAQMIARFPAAVLAAHPDLVLWQVGTNSVLRDHSLEAHAALLRQGIAQLQAADLDLVLMDMQYAPRVLAKAEAIGMEDQIALAAKESSVDLFGRFGLMRNWHEAEHIPFDTFVSADSLHMNDWGYACVAKLLAAAITDAATRPIASASHAQH